MFLLHFTCLFNKLYVCNMEQQNNSQDKTIWTVLGEQFWTIYTLIVCIVILKLLNSDTTEDSVYTLMYIFYSFIVLGSLKKAITVYSDKAGRWRFTDPLYLILMIGCPIVCVGAYNDYEFKLAFLITTGLMAVLNFTLLRLTDKDYDPEQGAKNAFQLLKKCPHCFSSLPSYFTSKCPHCTADL